MEYTDYMDAEMREIMNALGEAVVPRHKRKTVYRDRLHTPYYSRGRYARL